MVWTLYLLELNNIDGMRLVDKVSRMRSIHQSTLNKLEECLTAKHQLSGVGCLAVSISGGVLSRYGNTARAV